jgi:hypothetical protein
MKAMKEMENERMGIGRIEIGDWRVESGRGYAILRNEGGTLTLTGRSPAPLAPPARAGVRRTQCGASVAGVLREDLPLTAGQAHPFRVLRKDLPLLSPLQGGYP